MRHFLISLRVLLFMTLLTGGLYPLAMTAFAGLVNPYGAAGSLIAKGGKIIGSELISQKFESPRYFWSRPSAIDYNPLPSGGTNLGPTAEGLKKLVIEREGNLKSLHPDAGAPPKDLIFNSGSGLDPHISPQAARFQLGRVAKARGFNEDQRVNLRELVEKHVEKRQFDFLGEPRVNVLKLNLATDML